MPLETDMKRWQRAPKAAIVVIPTAPVTCSFSLVHCWFMHHHTINSYIIIALTSITIDEDVFEINVFYLDEELSIYKEKKSCLTRMLRKPKLFIEDT